MAICAPGLEAAGKPIGGNDMLIAAHAVSLDHTIVTDNEREFSRVDGLASRIGSASRFRDP
jgi:predicted nucleic acid-binding protein